MPQFSNSKPGTRSNSASAVTKVQPRASACAAISASLGPIQLQRSAKVGAVRGNVLVQCQHGQVRHDQVAGRLKSGGGALGQPVLQLALHHHAGGHLKVGGLFEFGAVAQGHRAAGVAHERDQHVRVQHVQEGRSGFGGCLFQHVAEWGCGESPRLKQAVRFVTALGSDHNDQHGLNRSPP